jgi:hypothetical protein
VIPVSLTKCLCFRRVIFALKSILSSLFGFKIILSRTRQPQRFFGVKFVSVEVVFQVFLGACLLMPLSTIVNKIFHH